MAGGGGVRVEDIRDRQEVRGTFLVRGISLRTAKNGKPYLSMQLGDKTGSVEARVWDDAERFDAACDTGEVVAVVGRGTSFQGKVQLHVNRLERLPPEAVALEDFMPASVFSPEEMLAALRDVVAGVEDPWIRKLLEAALADPAVATALPVAPAAKVFHHAWLGGLLEHTLSMCRVLLILHAHYDRLLPGMLDRDLLVAGAFFHDIGKILEISSGAGFEYTDEGRLVGHIVQGVELISAKAAAIEGFPPALLARVKHLVVAHHGKLEFGSPLTPRTAEAYLLHLVDLMDARMNAMNAAFREEAGQPWTSFNRMMEGFLLNPFGAAAEAAEGAFDLPVPDPSWMSSAPDAPDGDPPAGTGRKPRRKSADATPEEDLPGNLSLF